MSTTVDHDTTRKQLTEQAAAFVANPAGWPAAMGARALRLRAGHPAYSPTNQTLIVCQLWGRFERAGMTEDDAFTAAMVAAGSELAPRGVWRSRGFEPHGGALSIWSRPIPLWFDPATGERCAKDKPGAESRTVFRMEHTYLADDVRNDDGQTGAAAFTPPELPAGAARDAFDRLAGWIGAQGWQVTRTGRDSAENGATSHALRTVSIHGGLSEWEAVETLAHEIAHALLHGADDDRAYAGDHRGDMEAEAEAVAFGVLTAFGEGDLARGSARYAVEWARTPERVAVAYERASHVLDALVSVAMGAEDVAVVESAKAAKLASKADNKATATALRDAGLEPRGEAWRRAKAGESVADIVRDLAPPEVTR